jgi:hypothetical protein
MLAQVHICFYIVISYQLVRIHFITILFQKLYILNSNYKFLPRENYCFLKSMENI